MCGHVVGHDVLSVVVTGIAPVFALADFLVMCTCIKNGANVDRIDSLQSKYLIATLGVEPKLIPSR